MLGIPVLDGLALALCPFTGSPRDFSGAGRHPTQAGSGLYWGARGGCDGLVSNGTGHLVVANDATLEAITDLTVFVGGAGGDGVIMGKADAGGVQFDLSAAGDVLTLSDGSGVTATLPGLGNADSFAVTLASGGVAAAHIPGASPVSFSGTTTITADDAAITLLNYFTGAYPWRVPAKLVLLYSRELTTAEIVKLQVYAKARITPRKQWPGSGVRYPDRETNLLVDPADPASWIPVSSAIITEIENGVRVGYGGGVSPYGRQGGVVSAGSQVRVQCELRMGGAATAARVQVGGNNFSYTYTDFTAVDIVTVPGSVNFDIRVITIADGFAEFRNIKLWTNPPGYTHRTGDPTFLDNIQTARVTLVDETSGRLSNTPYQIESGTWALREDATTGERYIQCIAAGFLSRRNLFAYGTWEFELRKLNPNAVQIHIINSNCSINPGNVGYFFHISANESVQFYRDGLNTAHTNNSYVDPNVRYAFRVTRRTDGQFTMYVKGGSFVGWTLVDIVAGATPTNPFTDNVNTTSLYVLHDLDAGDRLYSDRQFAGVISPI